MNKEFDCEGGYRSCMKDFITDCESRITIINEETLALGGMI